MRELDKYKNFYNANKLSYLLNENVKLREPFENRLLRYDGNTREVEKLHVPKKVSTADLATIEFIEERRKRILKAIKEMDINDLDPIDIEEAGLLIEKLGLNKLEPGQIYTGNVLDQYSRDEEICPDTPAEQQPNNTTQGKINKSKPLIK